MRSEQQLTEQVIAVLEKETGFSDITPDTCLKEIIQDSLTAFGLEITMEEEFGVGVEITSWKGLKTVREVVADLRSSLGD